MKLKASYALESIKSGLQKHLTGKKDALDGVLNQLSWFEINTNLIVPDNPNPILAVANNIITRGEFTKPSLLIEEEFAQALQKTIRKEDELGNIRFDLADGHDVCFEKIWETLHIIDQHEKENSPDKIRKGNSTFETDFLFRYIEDENSFLRQLFQQQREVETIVLPEDRGHFRRNRVDFSIECPYYHEDIIQQFYWKRDVKIKRRHGVVIEIDGPDHEIAVQTIHDQNRDEALKTANWTCYRITPENQVNESQKAIQNVLQTDFIERIKKNFNKSQEDAKFYNQLVLSPLAIARIQKTIIRFFISNPELLETKRQFNIAIIERDVPCGFMAIQDLNELIKNLCLLKGDSPLFELKANVYSNPNYIDSPLHKETPHSLTEFDTHAPDIDLILDIAVLRRDGIFLDDYKFSVDNKTIIIRSVHFNKDKNEKLICADTIKYMEVVKTKPDGTYEEIEEYRRILEYFLQNLFRKKNFRIGQLPILSRALQLKSVIGLLPTGGGKSLTYQLASMLQPGVTLVVDPIKSLMVDQYDNLCKAGIENANFVNSTLDTIERKINISNLINGTVQFCFVSPERLVMNEFRESLRNCTAKMTFFTYCVIDEVHCVSEWGHDFRTPYLSLGKNARKYLPTFKVNVLNEQYTLPIFGLTATASFDVLADVERELEILDHAEDDAIVSFENTLRDELQYCLIKTDVPIGEDFNIRRSRVTQNLQKRNAAGWLDVKDERALKENIGITKQNEIKIILQKKFIEFIKLYNSKILEPILGASFVEYLDEKQKKDYIGAEAYIKAKADKIFLNEHIINSDNLWLENKNGFIIFVPHRSGHLGVTGRFKNPPNSNGVYDSLTGLFKCGLFMGSGDENESSSQEIENESFESLRKFINNEIAIMVATKAFGMGIDKPNIRATIHMNITSSLESFVQESGRAGRDGKLALCFLLYNEQILKYFEKGTYTKLFSGNTVRRFERKKVRIPDYIKCCKLHDINIKNLLKDKHRFFKVDFEKRLDNIQAELLDERIPENDRYTNREKLKIAAEEQWVDYDILEYFHYNSFKGIDKENVIVNELLDEITFPERQKFKEIEEEFNLECNLDLRLNFSNPPHEHNLWARDKHPTINAYKISA